MEADAASDPTPPPNSRFHVPRPPARPGDPPDFSHLRVPPAGSVRRPPIDAPVHEIRDLAEDLIRVLDDDGRATGPWDPGIGPGELRRALRAIALTRSYDARMLRAQRQGKTSFYLGSLGEEAIAVGQSLTFGPGDMCFPTYRQQGWLVARDHPLVEMMCQVLSNEKDPLEGRQMPIMYASRDAGFFTVSGNLATQFVQAVGWAMAAAISGDTAIACGSVGEGATAEADFHHGLVFASTYRAPVVLNVVNNQWAISSYQSIAGGCGTTFAARAIGHGLPGLRADGNDYLAVVATTRWAIERARAGLGPTLIEWVTYRAGSHSTSDDPGRYRPEGEWASWPLGDPLDRLVAHLCTIGEWDDAAQRSMLDEVDDEIATAAAEAESYGTMLDHRHPDRRRIFQDVFAEMPPHLEEQLHEMETFREGG
jgi:2-oxoisovalerate dehydrogenase E1 component alpha subunit